MPVAANNDRLVTTVSKATTAEIRRIAAMMGVPYRMVVSMALSVGLKVVAIQLEPSQFLTPEVLTAMAAIADKSGMGEPKGAEKERIEEDLALSLKRVQPAKPKRKAVAKSTRRKK